MLFGRQLQQRIQHIRRSRERKIKVERLRVLDNRLIRLWRLQLQHAGKQFGIQLRQALGEHGQGPAGVGKDDFTAREAALTTYYDHMGGRVPGLVRQIECGRLQHGAWELVSHAHRGVDKYDRPVVIQFFLDWPGGIIIEVFPL